MLKNCVPFRLYSVTFAFDIYAFAEADALKKKHEGLHTPWRRRQVYEHFIK